MKRLNFYVDGFNLYFGMVEAGFIDCKWLDIQLFAETLKQPFHDVRSVKYFTSRLSHNFEKQQRQNIYLDALGTTPVQIIYGQYRSQLTECTVCGNNFYDQKEKMTDVNIATQLIKDAFMDQFDEAILVSGDSDLVPPIKLIKELFPQKGIRIAFPPKRVSNELTKVSDGTFQIGHKKLQDSQLPGIIVTKYGQHLERPKSWY
jgi:uncharacterized LabA/DUF88 family protein